MAKVPRMTSVDDVVDGAESGAPADTLVDRGRAVLDRVPGVADSAYDALAGAQDQLISS
jgi:hypothetical protein